MRTIPSSTLPSFEQIAGCDQASKDGPDDHGPTLRAAITKSYADCVLGRILPAEEHIVQLLDVLQERLESKVITCDGLEAVLATAEGRSH